MMSGLCYSLIARQKVVLCDYAAVPGYYEVPSQTILENLTSTSETKISYKVDSLVYHVLASGGLRFLCVSDPVFDRGLAFGCLSELERRLYNTPGLAEKVEYVGPYALRRYFAGEMAAVLELYSSSDKLDHLQSQVKSVTGVMSSNLEKVMKRGDTLGDLEDRSERLAHSSTDFRHTAGKLKNKQRWRNIKLLCIILCIIFVIVLVLVACVIAGLAGTGHLAPKNPT